MVLQCHGLQYRTIAETRTQPTEQRLGGITGWRRLEQVRCHRLQATHLSDLKSQAQHRRVQHHRFQAQPAQLEPGLCRLLAPGVPHAQVLGPFPVIERQHQRQRLDATHLEKPLEFSQQAPQGKHDAGGQLDLMDQFQLTIEARWRREYRRGIGDLASHALKVAPQVCPQARGQRGRRQHKQVVEVRKPESLEARLLACGQPQPVKGKPAEPGHMRCLALAAIAPRPGQQTGGQRGVPSGAGHLKLQGRQFFMQTTPQSLESAEVVEHRGDFHHHPPGRGVFPGRLETDPGAEAGTPQRQPFKATPAHVRVGRQQTDTRFQTQCGIDRHARPDTGLPGPGRDQGDTLPVLAQQREGSVIAGAQHLKPKLRTVKT